MIYEDIGKKIQEAREDAGLSQEELASRLGLTQAALSNYELGKRRLDLNKLEKISSVLNKPLAYFLEESGTRQQTAQEDRLDETIGEMISLWSDMPEEERKYILDFIRWMRQRQS